MRKDAELQALIGTTAFFFFILIILFYFSVVIMVLWDHASLLYLKAKYAWLSLFPLTTRMCVSSPPLPLLRAVYLSPAASYCCAVSSFPYIHIYPYVCISVILFYTSVTIEPVCVFVLFLCCCFFFVVYLLLLALLFCSLFFFLIFFSCL